MADRQVKQSNTVINAGLSRLEEDKQSVSNIMSHNSEDKQFVSNITSHNSEDK